MTLTPEVLTEVQEAFSALNEAKAMVADLKGASTLPELDQLYEMWIGYKITEDDPVATEGEVREDLTDYIREFCYSTGVHCADAGLAQEI